MTENVAKSFRVPKIKRQESKDNLRQVDLNSRDAQEIVNVIKHSFLESNYKPAWDLKSVNFIENRELEERYRKKKLSFKDAKVPVIDQFAFFLCRDNLPIAGIVKQGLKCNATPVNPLGDSKLGVYLCKNADLQLRLAEACGLTTCYILVFKATLGKCKALQGQVGDELIEPTPNYDCHIHQNQPKPSDPFSMQLSRSQIYLYEYNDDCEPTLFPRQCLPYALVTYEKSETSSQPRNQTPSDSYSRRPSNLTEVSRSESTESDSSQKSDPRLRKDPRKTNSTETRQPLPEQKVINPADPRLAYKQLDKTGSLCVPRLTPGPPPTDPRIAVLNQADPRLKPSVLDPRLQQVSQDSPMAATLVPTMTMPGVQHITMSGVPPMTMSGVPPMTMSGVSPMTMSGVPPMAMPGALPLSMPGAPPLSMPGAPSLSMSGAPPMTIPGVPSMAMPGAPPMQMPVAPPMLMPVAPPIPMPVAPPISMPGAPPISMPGILPPGGPNQFPGSFFPNDPLSRGSIPPSARDPRIAVGMDPNSLYVPSFGPSEEQLQQTRLELLRKVTSALPPHARKDTKLPVNVEQSRDPRLQRGDTKARDYKPDPLNPYDEDLRASDPRLQRDKLNTNSFTPTEIMGNKDRKRLSLHEYKKKVLIQPSMKNEETTFSTPQTEMNFNSAQELLAETKDEKTDYEFYPKSPIEDVPEVIEEVAMSEDVVHRPDDMARTLNDLSDPEDESQSPEQKVEPEETEDDPALEEAMKKLVEYTSNVPLFTAALRSLQESAEEYGDSLTNPVFLVKKIAEYIDHLAKDKEKEQSESGVDEDKESLPNDNSNEDTEKDQEIQEKADKDEPIRSPDAMDISSDRAEDMEIAAVPEIPLENTETSAPADKELILSPMSKAMQKTLQAYETTPAQGFTGEVFAYSDEEKPHTDQLDESKKPNFEGPNPQLVRTSLKFANSNIDVGTIPLPNSPKRPSVKETTTKTLAGKTSFSFNLKKRSVSDKVASIFKENGAEKEDQDERQPKKLKPSVGGAKPFDDIDFGTEDKDMRNMVRSGATLDKDFRRGNIVSSTSVDITTVNESNKNSMPVNSASRFKIGEDTKNRFGAYGKPLLDKDERIGQELDKSGKPSVIPNINVSLLDKDERRQTGSPQIISAAFMDVDERSNSSTVLNEVFRNVKEDTDERIGSRSQSPAVLDGSQSKETVLTSTVKAENPVTESQSSSEDSGGLFDAYSIGKKSTTEPKSSEKTEGNEYGDVDWRVSAASEMGDVDLRASISNVSQVSGDIDMRSSNIDMRSSNIDLRSSYEQPQSYANTGYSYYTSGQSSAYTQATNVVQYNQPATTMYNYSTSKPTYESYTTSKGHLQSYSTYGEYRTSGSSKEHGQSGDAFSQSGAVEDVKQGELHPGKFQNLIHSLDFSNLKNILANVQPAAVTPAAADLKTSVPDDEDDTQNKPAFCTGLSFLKSKQPKVDLTRAKYTGVAKVPADVGPPPVRPPAPVPPPAIRPLVPAPPKPLVPLSPRALMDIPLPVRPPMFDSPPNAPKSLFDSPLFDSSPSKYTRSGIIPGFGDLSEDETDKPPTSSASESESPEKAVSAKQPFKFSEEIPDRDFSSEWYDNSYGLKQEQKNDSKVFDDKGNKVKPESLTDDWYGYDSGSRESRKKGDTPTKSKHRGKDSKPKYESSWQTAILESMEESELNVKHDDSYTTDMPESSTKEPECAKRLFETDDKEENEDSDCKKRKLEDVKEDTKKVEIVEAIDLDHESDDEEALVIDLNADTSIQKDSVAETVSNHTAGEVMSSSKSEELQKMADDTVVQKEEEEKDEKKLDKEEDLIEDEVEAGEILEEEDVVPTKSDEMKTLIEKSRKNMVIRLKGETKIVNPKTGKAYNESPTGSAIQVVGKPFTPAKTKGSLKYVFQNQKHERKDAHSGKKTPLPVSSKPPEQQKYRSPSPVNQVQFPAISSMVSAGVGFRSTSPVNQMSSSGTTFNPVNVKEYIHPLTGQKIHYGSQLGSNIPNIPQVVPVIGHPQSLVGIQRPPVQVPIVSNPPVLPVGMIQRPPFVVVGQQSASAPIATVSPVGLPPRMTSPVQKQAPGMAIQTIGSQAQAVSNPQGPSKEKKSSSDVFDWFSEKFEKRDKSDKGAFSPVEEVKANISSDNFPVKTETNYQFSQNSSNKIIKTVHESNLRQIDTNFKVEENVSDRERQANFCREGESEPKKIIKTSLDSDSSKPVEYKGNLISISTTQTLNNVKHALENPTEHQSSSEKKDATDTGASSELEDGEISDDSGDESVSIQQPPDTYRQVVMQERNRSIPVIGSWPEQYPGPGLRIQTIGSNTPESTRIVNIKSDHPRYIPSLENRIPGSSKRVGAEWSDMLIHPEVTAVEIVKGSNIEPFSVAGKDKDDASVLLSKSAASFSKAKQKIMARSQVKTLGDWLKVELETDNIQPLQNIIPYCLNTDLSIIPKQRRRKIRLKVKNAIELEGLKKLKTETQQQTQLSPPIQSDINLTYTQLSPPIEPELNLAYTQLSPPIQPDINLIYTAEVDNSQIEKELSLVRKTIAKLNMQRESNPNTGVNTLNLIVAMTMVENEMKVLLQRTSFYGYPHRRVPSELLLETEMQSFRAQATDVFLILMMPISAKPYHRLRQMKHDLERLIYDLRSAVNKLPLLHQIEQLHAQRQATMRSFTGYLNKRRIQKIQDSVDKYTHVYEYFKHQQPPVPESLLKFVRTTQMDLRQHLILAKQYHAMDEAKVGKPLL